MSCLLHRLHRQAISIRLPPALLDYAEVVYMKFLFGDTHPSSVRLGNTAQKVLEWNGCAVYVFDVHVARLNCQYQPLF